MGYEWKVEDQGAEGHRIIHVVPRNYSLFIPLSPSLRIETQTPTSERVLNETPSSNRQRRTSVSRAEPLEVDLPNKQVVTADPSGVKGSGHNTTTSYGIWFMLADAERWTFGIPSPRAKTSLVC